jgi:hypothetical protein
VHSPTRSLPWHAAPQVGANLLERDEKALVVSTGYFGDRFADWYLQPCACTLGCYYLLLITYSFLVHYDY